MLSPRVGLQGHRRQSWQRVLLRLCAQAPSKRELFFLDLGPPTNHCSQQVTKRQVFTSHTCLGKLPPFLVQVPGLAAESAWNQKSMTQKYPPLAENIVADVVVIGAGIAGLTCAYQLAKGGKECSWCCPALVIQIVLSVDG